jgi:hypothetical protein
VEAKDRHISEVQQGNRKLLQWTHIQETHIKELMDELLRAYRLIQDGSHLLDETCT